MTIQYFYFFYVIYLRDFDFNFNFDFDFDKIDIMARNKMKIIRACTVSLSIGFFDEIMRRMRGDGYEMVALTSPGPELDKLKEEGFHCIEVEMERHISPLKDMKSLIKMIRVLHREKPYMIHSMTPKAGLLCMMAGWLTGVPVRVHTFTGLVWPTSTGLMRKILMTTDKILCACATHIIPEGQGVMADLRSGGITKKPMKVLGYGNVKGVDMERFNPGRFVRNEHETFDFLFVGRIVGDKGINELVEAFTQLHEKYEKTKLILVGPYENNLDPVSALTNERIKANPAIIATGTKRGVELLQEYVDSDCCVMPSYREGFPNTVLEAGAMGKPQIVTDINGSREIVTNEENGLIVLSKDSKSLYDAMERMLTDEALCEKMKQNARPMIESRFEKKFVQGCLMSFYDEILNK